MSLVFKMQEMNKLLKTKICGVESCKDVSVLSLNSMTGPPATLLVIIVIDRSISMREPDYPPSRLMAAKHAAKEFVKALRSQNGTAVVSVISFGTNASVVLPPTPIGSEQHISKKISSIQIEGGTDIAKGLIEAEAVLSIYPNNRFKPQIILLTDGYGGSPTSIAEKLKFEYGSIIDVVGIGGNRKEVNEALLKKVATTDADGTSHYRFIKDRATLSHHYRQLATGLAWKRGSK